jgi:hypothetical protein
VVRCSNGAGQDCVRIGGGRADQYSKVKSKVLNWDGSWKLKRAQIGDVIPTVATDLDKNGPVLIVSLKVLHSYRGDQRKLMLLSRAWVQDR